MKLHNIFENKLKDEAAYLSRALQVCEKSSGGIFKRIDENRELLEFLRKEAPEFMERFFWIEGWIQGQDHFLNDLIHALQIENPFPTRSKMYPRPWNSRSGE